jgi:hypothetical protein
VYIAPAETDAASSNAPPDALMPTLQAAPRASPYRHLCPLVGAWRLARVELLVRDGWAGPRLYRGVTGRLEYHPDGRMSFELAEGSWRRAWHGRYRSYLDPYSPTNDLVIHRIEGASDPGLVGTEEERRVHLRGDTLAWPGAPLLIDGQRWTPRLVWERVAS